MLGPLRYAASPDSSQNYPSPRAGNTFSLLAHSILEKAGKLTYLLRIEGLSGS